MGKHIRICITIEKDLYELCKRYKVKISRICERALRDFLKENYGIDYKLDEEIKLDTIIKRALGKLK